ncbi:hypothetical protein L226DRAFT_365531 [Lentinus tigrinus ALCF2SS1-7]|uniref:uncharacterized protein n=1 Tax=Lentinus tigrinus ALCF2SS1-7 TaxID=1328758 RepID=UPI001165FFAD|nr:hypothetical protein L226DRAFT_365531 [Lentinus tigrinus ALCF2SS1-7]
MTPLSSSDTRLSCRSRIPRKHTTVRTHMLRTTHRSPPSVRHKQTSTLVIRRSTRQTGTRARPGDTARQIDLHEKRHWPAARPTAHRNPNSKTNKNATKEKPGRGCATKSGAHASDNTTINIDNSLTGISDEIDSRRSRHTNPTTRAGPEVCAGREA